MSIDRSRRIAFENSADLYNESRMGYPDQLIEDILSFSGISQAGRILEIGCGPGNATVLFAKFGYEILAIELGERLSAFAMQNCKAYPKVKVLNMPFEEWPVIEGSFDLAISADAFHWIQPEVGYPKVAQALKPTGKLAFFWNSPATYDPEISRAVGEVYKSLAPEVENPEGRFTVDWMVKTITETIDRSGCFDDVTVRDYPSHDTETLDNYINGLWTYSSHYSFDRRTRERLYEGIRTALEPFGENITSTREVVLFMAGIK